MIDGKPESIVKIGRIIKINEMNKQCGTVAAPGRSELCLQRRGTEMG